MKLVRRLALLLTLLALFAVAPAAAVASVASEGPAKVLPAGVDKCDVELKPGEHLPQGCFKPDEEFKLIDWVPIHLGSLNLSINKAVAYIMLGSFLTILLGIVLMRWKIREQPGGRQAVGEAIYEVAQVQVAEQGLPSKAIGTWFPYVATLMLFIWVINMVGFLPLPLSEIVSAIEKDPAIAAALVKYANSVVYAGLKDVTDLQQAVMRLGLVPVQQAVTALSARSILDHASKRDRKSTRLNSSH